MRVHPVAVLTIGVGRDGMRKPNAEVGMRKAEWIGRSSRATRNVADRTVPAVPRSTFHVPRSTSRRYSMLTNRLLSLSAALGALACNDTTVAPEPRVPGIQAMS